MGAELSTADKVRGLIVEHLGVTAEAAIDTASMIDDLGADSLDNVEVCMAVEEEFGVNITDDEGNACATVGDWINLVERKLAQ